MVEGHTDNTGSADFNQKLSEQRANGVRQYLVEQGIGAPRISAQGLGQTQPRVPNDSAANRQLNRRVELVISGDVIGTKVGGGGTQ
jgi:outer membrane protein OmpA-like peptidoglycan-associated protein